MHPKPLSSKKLFGQSVIFMSMFCFHLESVVVRWATTADMALNSPFLVFARFSFGFLVVALVFLLKRKIPRPRQYGPLVGRAITNVFAVFCSYKAVELTTVAEGTILNMTFPVFIGIFSWFLFKAQRDILALLMTVVAFCGIFLVLSPGGELHVEWNSLWGLTSGIIAAISLIMLNITRQQNDTDTVMLVVFGIGTMLMYFIFRDSFHIPNRIELVYLVSGAATAIIGQYLLTLGFRYVTPVEGGIISSSRILIAAILSPYMTSDPPLVLSGWIGALLILGANVYFIASHLFIDD